MNTPYKHFLKFPSKYDIYLDNSGYHWYIMVQCDMDGVNLPKISFEVTCDKLFKGDLIPTMRVLEENDSDTEIVAHGRAAKVAGDAIAGVAGGAIAGVAGVGAGVGAGVVAGCVLGLIFGVTGVGGNVTKVVSKAVAEVVAGRMMRGVMLCMSGTKLRKVGTMTTTIMKLSETAEAIRVGMGKYNLLTNNCQHFCNNVLKKLGLPTTPTTVGPTTTVNFDEIDQIFTIVPHKQGDESDGDMKG